MKSRKKKAKPPVNKRGRKKTIASKKKLPIQKIIFSKIAQLLPENVSLADELCLLLKISKDSAYRRIRCETELSTDELFIISSKYKLSIDALFSNQGEFATFQYISLVEDSLQFEKYLNSIVMNLSKINSFPQKQIIYAAEEVPIFYAFLSPRLAAFKMFYWQRSVLNVPELQHKKFETNVLNKSLFALGKKIESLYSTIPSVEIWTEETILTVIKQLEFYVESGVFTSREDALSVAHSISEMITSIRTYAETSSKIKTGEANFQLYKSDVTIGTNCIHIDAGGNNFSFISFNTLNSLTTSNASFCKETEYWIKNLIRKSSLISGTAEKQRYQFFNNMIKQIESSKEKIMNTFL